MHQNRLHLCAHSLITTAEALHKKCQ